MLTRTQIRAAAQAIRELNKEMHKELLVELNASDPQYFKVKIAIDLAFMLNSVLHELIMERK